MDMYQNPLLDAMMYPDPYAWDKPKPMSDRPLAMAYMMRQLQMTNVFSPEEALRKGTLFPELYKPFIGKRGEL